MNFLQRLIVDRAEKIKQREQQNKSLKFKEVADEAESDRLFLQRFRDSIEKNLEQIYNQKLIEKSSLHIKEGDEAVVNHYDIIRNSANSWDGGAKQFSKHIKRSEFPDGLKVKIKEVRLSKTLAYQRVDSFFDKADIYKLRKEVSNPDILGWSHFVKNCASDSYPPDPRKIFDRFGFYWEATFEVNTEFVPKWGLNINSFIAKDQPGYKETLETSKLENQIQDLKRKQEETILELNRKIQTIRQSVNC